ncbi:serine protease [Candidatus Falkowbacteria bacterium]|nr:serine protease [Candidatus Falkowbacteria bacterium]
MALFTHHRPPRIVWLLIGVLLLGALSSFFGQLAASRFILHYLGDDRQVAELNNVFYELLAKYDLISNSGEPGSLEIVIRQPQLQGSLGLTEEVSAGDWLDNLVNSTVTFFPTPTGGSTDVLLSAYRQSEALGRGSILTNDGWLLTTNQVLSQPAGAYMVVMTTGEVLPVTTVVSDPLTEAVFAKVALANASIVSLNKNLVVAGTAVAALDNTGGLQIGAIENNQYRLVQTVFDTVASSDRLDSYYLPSNTLDAVTPGEPVVDARGRLIGLALTDRQQMMILPLLSFASEIDEVLRDGAVRRASLGVDYLDIGQLTMNPQIGQQYQSVKAGALIYRNTAANIAGVRSGSPAATAALQAGQVITRVNGDTVGRDATLGQLVQAYDPGQEIDLTVWDTGQEKIVPVVLGESR